MAKVVPLPVRQLGVDALCARLRHLESAESPDEATMEAVANAEQSVLATLVGACSSTLAEVMQKLIVVARRADAADGFLSDSEQALLRSAMLDLHHFDPATAVA